MITRQYSNECNRFDYTKNEQRGDGSISNSSELLNAFWKESGKTKTYLAKKIGVSRPRLDYIFEHPDTATWSQAEVLSKELSIKAAPKDNIFLPYL